MTKEQKLTILDDALLRAYEELEAATRDEMDTPQIKTLLENISAMEWAADKFRYPYGIPVVPEEPTEVSGVVEAQIPAEPEPTPAASAAPEEPQVAESQYKMEDVRAALAKARGKGVNVSEIIRSFGVDAFPQIPKSQYDAVMAKLAEAEEKT